ncbi:GIY-YIG nuclease family protein [archaeon]|jgi:putative endonuclease|nr:GIY-YIG nuclease family protein [archaeon]MBT6182766.1 GIY-YIG nuclease family protein [archaeon]MBT6606144.1 GIY-YIG nuclease family protein [archaeon]MBT7252016.1 GIY-YIG nuclease family protein [archaeon]MBT7660918.1 GIY-YIG nuclease family protein [archaeon]
MEEKSWVVYLLECSDGSWYTGITNDIDKRMKIQSSGKGSKYVARKGFKKLLATEKCLDKSDALKKEYKIKQLPKFEKLNWFN